MSAVRSLPSEQRRSVLLTLVLFLGGTLGVSSPLGEGLSVSYFPQIGVGATNNIQFHTDMVFINGGGQTPFLLEFFDSKGQPLPLDVFIDNETTEPQSQLSLDLTGGQTLNLSLRSSGPLQAGYVRLTSGESVQGWAAYTQTDLRTNTIQYQAGVQMTQPVTRFSFPAKYAARLGDMAVAMVNVAPASSGTAGETGARILMRIYDEPFNLVDTRELTLPQGHHLPRFVAELFPVIVELAGGVGFNGSVTVESDQPLAAVSVLLTHVPTLTTLPVTSLGSSECRVGSGEWEGRVTK